MNKGSSGKDRKRRKRVVLSIKSKLLAINRIENGESVRTLALELGVSESTIKGWQKCRKEYEEFCVRTKAEGSIVSRSTCKRPTLQVLDQALWLWFKQERKRGTQITGVILKGRALYLNNIFGENSVFTASEGWLHRWKRRHGVYQTTFGDKLSGERTLDADIPEETSDNAVEAKIDLIPETSCKRESVTLSEEPDDIPISHDDRVSSDSNHNDDDDGELSRISHSEGEAALDLAMRYVEQQASSNHKDILTLIKWRDYAKTKRKAHKKQKLDTK